MAGSKEMKELRRQLREKLLARMPGPGLYQTAVEGLSHYRKDVPTVRSENCFYRPLVTMPLQGVKRSIIGADEYCYGEGQCLVASVEVPVMSHVVVATPRKPFVTLTLQLDKYLIGQLIAEMPRTVKETVSTRGTEQMEVDFDLLSAFARLFDLLDKKEQIPVLAPLIVREIHYRLLTSPVGGVLRSINTAGTQCNEISRAVSWLKEHYRETFQVEKLAQQFSMSPSTFHRRFKQVTTLSPVQYQKRLRLHEAQRLMLTEGTDAYHAALMVGYESPTQFNREYKRLFGEPPRRNVNRLGNV